VLVYFTALLMHKDAVDKVEYGFDKDPSERVKFTPSSGPSREIANDDQVYTEVPPGTKQVTIRITFKDGTTTAVRRFDAPASSAKQAPPPAAEPKPEKGGLPPTGVKVCDDVFRDTLACYKKIAPQALGQITDGFRQTADSIRQGIKQGVKPELYVDTCEQIRKSMKDALVQQGCKF
jgi:hypothetical protein